MSKIAYFDCFSGISGDMIIGALVGAGLDIKILESELDKLRLSNYKVNAKKVLKNKISATKFSVISKERVTHRNLADLYNILDGSIIDRETKTQAKKIFLKIAEAEAKIHNEPVAKIHFHEIGAIDTIIDVVGTLIGLKILGIKKVFCSCLNVGSGFVEFSHGKFPVPAPATAEILRGIPTYSTASGAELVTPTGAAIISTLAVAFGNMPAMETESIGYGAGTRDLGQPNLLRVFIGKVMEKGDMAEDRVFLIETNIDDMNPQLYEYVMETLLQNGALDVYLTNILMKKNRPGIKLTVLSNPRLKDRLVKVIFEETTSIGVRIREEKRTILQREVKEVDTMYGTIKVKISRINGRIVNAMPEYEDCKKIAKKKNISLKEIYRAVDEYLRPFYYEENG